MQKTYIIIGTSAAGISALQHLRRLDAHAEIIAISDESELPYNKCHLADYMAGLKTVDQVGTLNQKKIEELGIIMMLGKRVTTILSNKKVIQLNDDGQSLHYDALLLATGSSAIIPPIIGINHYKGIFTFHTLNDMHAIMQYAAEHNSHRVIVIGAGLTGLECADALHERGLRVTVLEKNDEPLQAHTTQQGAAYIRSAMEKMGVVFHGGKGVTRIEGSEGCVTRVWCGQDYFAVDMIIIASGVRSNSELAGQAGLKIEQGAVVVNDSMQTSDPAIYAAGDVALVPTALDDTLTPNRTWPDAMQQGMIAAHGMAGIPKKYPGIVPILSSSFFGIKFASFGTLHSIPSTWQKIEIQADGFYHCYLLDEQGMLKGFSLVGNTSSLSRLKRAVLTREKVSKEQLLGGF